MSYGLCGASKEDRDYYELKQAAAEYYRSRNVPERLEEALNSTFFLSPEDVYGHLANYFAQFSKTPIICSIRGKKVLDGTGKATVEVEVLCTVKNTDKSICSSVLSAHSELPYLASSDALEASEEERIKSVDIALEWIKDSLSPLLKGMPPNEQCNIDKLLSEYLKPKIEEENERTRIEKEEREAAVPPVISLPPPAAPPKSAKKKGSGKGKKTAAVEKPIPPEDPPETTIRGSLAIGGVSLALAKASAIINNTPLYLHIASLKQDQLPTELAMPIPMITLLSYGKSSPGKLNLMKEVLVFPKPGLTMQQSVDMAVALQKQIVKQIDSASKTGNKGKYEVVTGTFKSPDEMVDMYVDVISRHPAVVALIDPLRKEDALQWQSMGTTLGSRCYLIADVASKSVSNLLINRTVKIPMSSGIVIKHSNETTVSDLMEVFRLVEGEKHVTVLGCKYEESVDDSLVDLAVGLGARFIKLGGLLRGERTTKYNRLLAIEEGLTQNGTLGKQPEHEFPVLCNDIQSPTSQEEEQRLKCVQTAEKPGGAHIR
ncbi:hypothetical protein FKM82_014686 [Ascaphus truei]